MPHHVGPAREGKSPDRNVTKVIRFAQVIESGGNSGPERSPRSLFSFSIPLALTLFGGELPGLILGQSEMEIAYA